ncbi:TCR/Tet family MFS transporter [Rhodophyticola sp. SM2404]
MRHNLPTVFILITVVINSIGIGLILPVMPDLIEDVQGASLSDAALWGGVLAASYAVMQFLFSPVVGNLSDRFGRRPVLLLSLFVMMLDYIVLAFADSIWLLLLGRLIAGGAASTQSTALAYMADISAPEKRAKNFGLISAGFGVGFVLGPIIGGFLGGFDLRAPFIAAACIAGANLLLGWFLVPETLADENRRPFQWKRANPLGGLQQIGKLPGVKWLLVVMLAYQISNYVYPAIWAYYTQAAFDWDVRMVGLSLTAYGVAMAITQGVLISPIMKTLGEMRAIQYGLALNIVSLVAFGFASAGWIIWFLIPISALGAVVAPAMQSFMSRAAGNDQQGELQGVLSSIAALSMIISPLVMTQAFFWFTRDGASLFLPGAPFLVATVLMGASLVIFTVTAAQAGQAKEA